MSLFVSKSQSTTRLLTECGRSDQMFRDLDDMRSQALGGDFALIYQRASENRDRRERIVSVMEELIANAKSKNTEQYEIAAQEFSEIEIIYNRQIDDLYSILDHLKLQHHRRSREYLLQRPQSS